MGGSASVCSSNGVWRGSSPAAETTRVSFLGGGGSCLRCKRRKPCCRPPDFLVNDKESTFGTAPSSPGKSTCFRELLLEEALYMHCRCYLGMFLNGNLALCRHSPSVNPGPPEQQQQQAAGCWQGRPGVPGSLWLCEFST